jgi:WD40 repeat protein
MSPRPARPGVLGRGDRIASRSTPISTSIDTRTGRSCGGSSGTRARSRRSSSRPTTAAWCPAAVDRTVRTWDLGSGRSEVHAGFEGIVSEVEPLADGRSILAVSTAGEVRLFEPHRAGQVLTEHAAPTTGLALSADGRVASIDEQGRLRISDLAGRAIAEHGTPPARQIHLVTAPDGRSFAGVPRRGIRSDGRYPDPSAPPATLLLGDFDASRAALDPAAGRGARPRVARRRRDRRARRRRGAARRPRRRGHRARPLRRPATSVAVAPTAPGSRPAARTARCASATLATGRRRELHAHSERVTGLAFAADGMWLASGCADHTVRLWRLADGTFRAFDEGGHGVEQVGFSADGARCCS